MLTRIEELILLAVHQLREDAYGVTIRGFLEEQLDKPVSVGAIYVPLDRLVKQGLLSAQMADPTPERGGRRKRFFTLTTDGIDALIEVKRLHDSLWSGASDLYDFGVSTS